MSKSKRERPVSIEELGPAMEPQELMEEQAEAVRGGLIAVWSTGMDSLTSDPKLGIGGTTPLPVGVEPPPPAPNPAPSRPWQGPSR